MLNLSNSLSELCIFGIFCILAINLLNVPQSFHDNIDTYLVQMINVIMGIQMAASIIIFITNIGKIIKLKLRRNISLDTGIKSIPVEELQISTNSDLKKEDLKVQKLSKIKDRSINNAKIFPLPNPKHLPMGPYSS
jgi:hypothetical protein